MNTNTHSRRASAHTASSDIADLLRRVASAGPALGGRYQVEVIICQKLGRLATGQAIEFSASETRRLRALIDESVHRLCAGKRASCDAEAVSDVVTDIAFDAVEPFFWAFVLGGAIDSNRGVVVNPRALSVPLE